MRTDEMSEDLDDVCSRVSEAWFPVNPLLLSKIQARLAAGTYDGNTDSLIEEIKSDAALFAYSLKELAQINATNSTQKLLIKNPVETMRNAGVETLKSVLSRTPGSISVHSFDSIKTFQADVLKQTMVGAVASEMLAPNFEVPADMGYSCSLLRQLGLTLIAWNYPRTFAHALEKGTGRDEYLFMVLGFSPALLAFTLARKWGLSPELRRGMGEKNLDELANDPVSQKLGETLEKICRTGEVIAQMPASGSYPSARADWESARNEIRHYLGDNGFSRLEKRIAQVSKYYLLSAPELFTIPPLTQEETIIFTPKKTLTERNPYIRGCPAKIQEKLETLYSRMDLNATSKDNVEFLMKQVIPAAGFTSGCVYLLEVDYQMLVPMLPIGSSAIESYKSIRYNTPENKNHPVVRGLLSSTPVFGERKLGDDEWVSFISGSIGYLQKAGVLYMEFPIRYPGAAGSAMSQTHKTLSKALRQALSDCLNLE